MHILQINTVCGIGSTGRIAIDLQALLVKLGHQGTIAFGRNTAINCTQTIRIGNNLDSCLHVAKTRLLDAHGFGSAAATKAFLKKIETLDPDVIHLHNLHGYYIHIGLLFDFLKDFHKPVVWTLHDCWAMTGHCAHFEHIDCNLWKDECHDCPAKSEYPKSWFLDGSKWNHQKKKKLLTGVRNLTIVTPSRWLERLVKGSYLRDYPLSVIYNGIDLNVFKPVSSDFRNRHNLQGKFVLLGVASAWVESKGFAHFIELAKKLKSDEKIVLVGVNDEQVRHLPLEIIGISRTGNINELAEIYSAVDLFVNPTLADTFPTTNLEALACGTPVVTFNTGGCSECLEDGCGLVVERGNIARLVEAIADIKQAGKASYSAKCRERAENFYDSKVQLAEYVSLYKTII
ncbi:MAG: glycosyltransferase [Chloroflexota bacterium]